jgi:sugar phosphate isomerase/epimerase
MIAEKRKISSDIRAIGLMADSADGGVAALADRLAEIAELGADTAEITISGIDVVAGGRILEAPAAELAAATRRFPLRYCMHGLVCSDFMDAAHLEAQMRVARAYLELCERIGAGVLVHHSGALLSADPTAIADAEAREAGALAELAEIAARHGVRIALENIFSTRPGEHRRRPSGVAGLVRAIGHPNLVALIDFSHAYIECTRRGLDPRAELRAMAPVAGHLHLHDSFGLPRTTPKFHEASEATALGEGDLHLPLGWGDIPFAELFAELTFLPDTMAILELPLRYRREWPASLAAARGFAARSTATTGPLDA